jgi:hypothetical protein
MDEFILLKEENEQLKKRVAELEEHLKKYTAPARSKTYYENHKEELLEKMKKYKPTPEQIKERNRKAYLKRKEKMNVGCGKGQKIETDMVGLQLNKINWQE